MFRILVEGVDPILGRHGERVVHRSPLGVADCHIVIIRIVGGLEQREVHNPSESEIVGLEQTGTIGKFHTHGTQQLLSGGATACCEEHGIAVFRANGFLQASALLLRQVLSNRSLELAVLSEHHVGEALGAALLGPILPSVELAARRGCTTLEEHRTNVRSLEHAERSVLEVVSQLDQRIAETQIRLVGTVLIHGFLPSDALNRQLDFISCGLPDGSDDLFSHSHHIFLIHECHFHIKLGELRLAVGTEVLITVATCQLVVAFHARDHEQLLEQLRGLRQRVPGTRHQTGRHHEIAGTLRRGLDHGWSFDLFEAHLLQSVACGLRHLGTQLQIALHGRTTQIEITILETNFLTRQLVLRLVLQSGGHLERQRIGLGKHLDAFGNDLDLAGGQMIVLIAVRTQANLAYNLNHKLGTQRTCHVLVINDNLHQTSVVAKIDEGHAAVVATTINPTGERHLLTDEFLGHFGCMMCSISRLAHASPIPYSLD